MIYDSAMNLKKKKEHSNNNKLGVQVNESIQQQYHDGGKSEFYDSTLKLKGQNKIEGRINNCIGKQYHDDGRNKYSTTFNAKKRPVSKTAKRKTLAFQESH